jgi:hypothetical protein
MIRDSIISIERIKKKEISKTEEFKLLSRRIKEQTRKGKYLIKIYHLTLYKTILTHILPNKKSKKKHIGYTVNLMEKFDGKIRIG